MKNYKEPLEILNMTQTLKKQAAPGKGADAVNGGFEQTKRLYHCQRKAGGEL
jgi:hypothetical protein